MLLGECVCQVVHYGVIKVVAAQVGVSVGSQYLEYSVAQLKNGYIECTAAQVVYENLVGSLFLIKSVCKGRCSRLVDDSLYVETRNLSGVLCRLLLRVGEVCRNCDYRFRYLLAQIAFRIGLKLGQNHCGNVLRSVFLTVDFNGVILSHMSLYRRDGSLRIGYRLSLGGLSHQSLSVLRKAYNGRCGSVSFCVRYYYRLAAFKHRYAAVGRS